MTRFSSLQTSAVGVIADEKFATVLESNVYM